MRRPTHCGDFGTNKIHVTLVTQVVTILTGLAGVIIGIISVLN